MAYLIDDEHKKQDEQGQETGGPEQVIAGQSGAMPASNSGSAPQAQAGAAKQPSKSGSFTNLMSYVGANQDSGARMGTAVAGAVKAKAEDATRQTTDWSTNSGTSVAANTVQQDTKMQQDLVNDPTKVDKKAFGAQLGATYTGPNVESDVEGWDGVTQAYNQVDDRVEQSRGGLNQRIGLLEEVYGTSPYSAGEKRLDSFILGTGEGGKAQLKGIQDDYGGFRSNLGTASNLFNGKVSEAKATTKTTAEKMADAVAAAKLKNANILTNATNSANTTNAANETAFNDSQANLKKITGGDRLSQIDALMAAGISREDANLLFRQGNAIAALNIISPTKAKDKLAGDFISPEEKAAQEALWSLFNETGNFDFSTSPTEDAPVTGSNMPSIKELISQSQVKHDTNMAATKALVDAAAAKSAHEVKLRQEERDRQLAEQARIDKEFAENMSSGANTMKAPPESKFGKFMRELFT